MRIIGCKHKALTLRTPGISLNLLSAKETGSSALAITLFVNQNSGAASFIAPGVLSADDLQRALTEIRTVVTDCCHASDAQQ